MNSILKCESIFQNENLIESIKLIRAINGLVRCGQIGSLFTSWDPVRVRPTKVHPIERIKIRPNHHAIQRTKTVSSGSACGYLPTQVYQKLDQYSLQHDLGFHWLLWKNTTLTFRYLNNITHNENTADMGLGLSVDARF